MFQCGTMAGRESVWCMPTNRDRHVTDGKDSGFVETLKSLICQPYWNMQRTRCTRMAQAATLLHKQQPSGVTAS